MSRPNPLSMLHNEGRQFVEDTEFLALSEKKENQKQRLFLIQISDFIHPFLVVEWLSRLQFDMKFNFLV